MNHEQIEIGMETGEMMKLVRTKHDLTQYQLAEYLGICPNNISRMEKGKIVPKRYFILNMLVQMHRAEVLPSLELGFPWRLTPCL